MRAAPLSALIVVVIVGGLTLDRVYGVPGQIGVTVVVWALLIWLCWRSDAALRTRLMACVWISGAGEIGASLLWRLYDYQFLNVPLFVPPGHALLYLFGMVLAQWLPPRVAGLVPWLAAPPVLLLGWIGADTLSLCLFALFVLFMRFGRNRPLYATMFVLALVMEIIGTAIGNWHWPAEVRLIGLTTLNPPIAAGVFYCALDSLVGRRMRLLTGAQRDPPRTGLTPANPRPPLNGAYFLVRTRF